MQVLLTEEQENSCISNDIHKNIELNDMRKLIVLVGQHLNVYKNMFDKTQEWIQMPVKYSVPVFWYFYFDPEFIDSS